MVTDSAAEHSYDEDDAHILSPLLDDNGSARIQVTKSNGSRPNSGVKEGRSGEGSTPLVLLSGPPNSKSKAIAIGNGRSSFSNSPMSAALLMSEQGGVGEDSDKERRRRRHRKMTVGSSDSSNSSHNSSDNEGHGDAFDSNIKFL